MAFNSLALGLPIVGPQVGESTENVRHRRDVLRNVSLEAGPQRCVGIPNREFDCYLISIVQAFLHHPRTAQFCRHHHIGPRLREHGNVPLESHQTYYGCGFCELYEMLVRYWTKDLTHPDRVIEVESRFRKFQDRFENFRLLVEKEPFSQNEQHDASEAYNDLIQWLRLSNDCDSGASSAQAVSALFELQLKSVKTCSLCERDEEGQATSQPLLTLPFPESATTRSWDLQALIKHQLEGELYKKCTQCSSRGDVRFKTVEKVTHFPELLCMNLLPYTYEGRMSEHNAVIPMTIDTSAYSEIPMEANTMEYELSAVVQHRGDGQSINVGHYTAFIKADDDTWALCNDDKISQSTFDKAVYSGKLYTPFLLFYTRKYPVDSRTADIRESDAEYVLPAWMRDLEQPSPAAGLSGARAAQEIAAPGPVTPETQIRRGRYATSTPASRKRRATASKTPTRQQKRRRVSEDSPTSLDKLLLGEVESEVEGEETEPTLHHSAHEVGPEEADSAYRPGPDEEAEDDADEPEPAGVQAELEQIAVSPPPADSAASTVTEAQIPFAYMQLRVVDLRAELVKRGIKPDWKLRKAELANLLEEDDAGGAKVKVVKRTPSPKSKSPSPKAQSYTSLRVVDLKAELRKRKITFAAKLNKTQLKNLLIKDDKKGKTAKGVKGAKVAKAKAPAKATKATKAKASVKVPAKAPAKAKVGKKAKATPAAPKPVNKKRAVSPEEEGPRRSKRLRKE